MALLLLSILMFFAMLFATLNAMRQEARMDRLDRRSRLS